MSVSIGKAIHHRRTEQGLSLQQVADAAGLSRAHIWDLEQEKATNPTIGSLYAIASALRTDISYLLGLTSNTDCLVGWVGQASLDLLRSDVSAAIVLSKTPHQNIRSIPLYTQPSPHVQAPAETFQQEGLTIDSTVRQWMRAGYSLNHRETLDAHIASLSKPPNAIGEVTSVQDGVTIISTYDGVEVPLGIKIHTHGSKEDRPMSTAEPVSETERLSKAIFDARADPEHGYMSWETASLEVRQFYTRCADAALSHVQAAEEYKDALYMEHRRSLTTSDDNDLTGLLEEAAAKFKAMTPEGQEAMLRVQRDGYVKAEIELSRLERETTTLSHVQAPAEVVQWTRESLAIGLATLDDIVLQKIKSTVGPAEDANNWREYLGRADDLMALMSWSSAPAPQVDEAMVERAALAICNVERKHISLEPLTSIGEILPADRPYIMEEARAALKAAIGGAKP